MRAGEKCSKCGKVVHLAVGFGTVCRSCRYQAKYADMLEEDHDYQDWEFAYCEECGSQLDSVGDCPNTSCGASPRCGENWY